MQLTVLIKQKGRRIDTVLYKGTVAEYARSERPAPVDAALCVSSASTSTTQIAGRR